MVACADRKAQTNVLIRDAQQMHPCVAGVFHVSRDHVEGFNCALKFDHMRLNRIKPDHDQ